MKRKIKKSDLDFKVDLKILETEVTPSCEHCDKDDFLESLKILSTLPLPKISSKKIIERYGEDFLIEAITGGITSIEISEEDLLQLFLKKKILKKSDLKPEFRKKIKI